MSAATFARLAAILLPCTFVQDSAAFGGVRQPLGRRAAIVGATRATAAALLFTSTCILCLLSLPFSELIELDMSLYACSLSMEMLSLLRLRWTEPELHRPYRVPLGRRALCLMCAPPLCLCGLVVFMSVRTPSMRRAWGIALGLGATLYTLGPRCFRQQRGRPTR